ncbi:MAG: serine/threonine protein kinase [Alphaproteobacteria bacterium]|nr:MAG: serine/threonine protein kinase [Alphaproteobacteria bacterium]
MAKDGASLFLGYALILFAVPTLGVSVVVGLLATMGRGVPDNAVARSHRQYQRRTLFAAAVAAVVGLVLIAAPFALGVPVLFLLAIWVIVRGASGVLALKAGRAIRHPSGWWI